MYKLACILLIWHGAHLYSGGKRPDDFNVCEDAYACMALWEVLALGVWQIAMHLRCIDLEDCMQCNS